MATRRRSSEASPKRTERPSGAQASADIGRLELSGAQTIRVIDDIQAKLRELVSVHTRIEIDCAALTEADLSLVQLLLAARDSAEKSGKTIALAAPATGALLNVLSRGGFVDPAGGPATADAGFWLKGMS